MLAEWLTNAMALAELRRAFAERVPRHMQKANIQKCATCLWQSSRMRRRFCCRALGRSAENAWDLIAIRPPRVTAGMSPMGNVFVTRISSWVPLGAISGDSLSTVDQRGWEHGPGFGGSRPTCGRILSELELGRTSVPTSTRRGRISGFRTDLARLGPIGAGPCRWHRCSS